MVTLVKKKKKAKKFASKSKLNKNLSLFINNKELANLKAVYKKGELRFDSKEIAKGILEDLGRGIIK